MSRAILKEGKQKEILELIRLQKKLSWHKIASFCNISSRSLFDWRREKYKMPHHYESSGICRIRVSSLNLIDYLLSIGLQRGRKIKQQFDISFWITENDELRVAFVRGLMDTEGSFYSYRHIVRNRVYENSALCFTNYSDSLRNLFFSNLKDLGFNPRVAKNRIYLNRWKEISRYFKEVGSHNPKHLQRYKSYLAIKNCQF